MGIWGGGGDKPSSYFIVYHVYMEMGGCDIAKIRVYGKAHVNIKSALAAEHRYARYIQLHSRHRLPGGYKSVIASRRPSKQYRPNARCVRYRGVTGIRRKPVVTNL